MPYESAASRAKGGANRHFLLARAGASQQQAGDIDTRHEQHERDRAEKDEQRRADTADYRVVQRCYRSAVPVLVLSVFIGKSPRNPSHLGARLFDRRAGLETCHDVEDTHWTNARYGMIGNRRVRDEHLDALRREAERRRHHAHHLIRIAAEQELAPKDGVRAGELALPEPVTQHH